MAAIIGEGVTLRGFYNEDSQFTFNLAAGITPADRDKAVSVDLSGPNKVKLAADGDVVIGRLYTVEDRKSEGLLVGTVVMKFANTLPIKSGATVAVGDTVVGAGAGEVKAAATKDHTHNFVAEVIGNLAVVVQI